MREPVVIRHDDQPRAEWRPGVSTRLWVAESTGAQALCLGEQWFEPGAGAPLHTHPGVEETITVLEGRARFELDGESVELDVGKTIVLPADSVHGFVNVGDGVLHVLGVYSAAAPPTIYVDDPDVMLGIGGVSGVEVDATRVRYAG